jgi:hypothetical protein
MITFAIIVDNEVASTLVITDENESLDQTQRLAAALRSDFTILETENHNVKPGWTWDGTNFVEPLE